MSTIFATSINYREQGPGEFQTTDPSETQPDEVMSVRDMLSRHVQGLPVRGVGTPGQFLPEELGYIPDPKTLDLTELHDLRDDFRARAEQVEAELQERDKSDKKAKSEAEKAAKKRQAWIDKQINKDGDGSPDPDPDPS